MTINDQVIKLIQIISWQGIISKKMNLNNKS